MIYQIKADKLAINNTKADYRSYIYMAPSNRMGTTGLGQLFIIIEAKSREKKIPAILNQIVEELSEYYYHSPTRNTEAALETMAQYFNENIIDITGKNTKWVKDKISILIVAIQDNKIILSNYGNIKVWMFRDNKIHDITGGQTENKKNATTKKILSQLISGQLSNDDILLLTNNTIFDYFSDEKIKKTLVTLAPTQACAFLKNTLLDYKVAVDFSTIVIKFLSFKKEELGTGADKKTAENVLQADEGIERLNKAEPTIWWKIMLAGKTKIKNTFGWLAKILAGLVKPKIKSKKQAGEEKEEIAMETGQPAETEQKAYQADELKEGKGEWLMKFKKWKSFNIIEYRLVILIAVIAILFGGSLFLVNNKKDTQKRNEEFQETVDNINNKLNSVEAALIYKDEQRAQELLSESMSLLESMRGESAEQQYTYQQLKLSIEKQVNKIYKLEKIENPSIIAYWPEDFVPTSNIYIGANNIIYLARGGEIYKINSKNQSLDKITDIQAQIKKILNFEKNKLLLFSSQNETWILDINNNSTRKVAIDLVSEESEIQDIASYAKKIYLLDSGANNIYKYSYNTTNFSNPEKWLKNGEDIKGNISITVDGNIWLSAKDGKISKFFKGKKEIFSLKGAYQPISNETLLVTGENLKNLYLLDKAKNIILVADKQGKVIKQLLGDKLEEIISIAPNENEQELYLITAEGKAYMVEL